MKEKFKSIGVSLKNFYNTRRKLATGILVGVAVLLLSGGILLLILKPPSPPEDLRATVRSYDEINLTWIDQQRSDGYNIYRSEELHDNYEKVDTTSNRHYLDTGLEPSTTYYYRVTKIQKNKESDYSREVHATTEPVGTVSRLRVGEVGHDYIHLTWEDFYGSEGYVVYRTDGPDRPYREVTTTSNNYYFDSNLEKNRAYYYVVTQIIDGEESEYSTQIIAATRDWSCGTAINYDDKFYSTINISEQCWLAENLNYEAEEGSWCYRNESDNCDRYGRLYDWNTALTVCPEGWSLPTDDDYKTLEREMGMSRIEANETEWRGEEKDVGDLLKIASECSQIGEDFCGNSRLNIMLGGSRSSAGAFRYLGTHGFLWTSTPLGSNAYRRLFSLENASVHRGTASTENGFHVRCIKD